MSRSTKVAICVFYAVLVALICVIPNWRLDPVSFGTEAVLLACLLALCGSGLARTHVAVRVLFFGSFLRPALLAPAGFVPDLSPLRI